MHIFNKYLYFSFAYNNYSAIINLIEELYYWEKTAVEIPHQAVKLHEKNEIYSRRILRAVHCTKSYNR